MNKQNKLSPEDKLLKAIFGITQKEIDEKDEQIVREQEAKEGAQKAAMYHESMYLESMESKES